MFVGVRDNHVRGEKYFTLVITQASKLYVYGIMYYDRD